MPVRQLPQSRLSRTRVAHPVVAAVHQETPVPAHRRLCLSLLSILLACCLGCPLGTIPAGGDHGDLRTAEDLTPDSSGTMRHNDAIASSNEFDIFSVGTLEPGDRIIIDVQTTSGSLDPVAALLDSRAYVIALNDDRTPDGSNTNPLIDVIIRGDADEHFVAVSPYAGEFNIGQYDLTVRIQRGVSNPSSQAQIVFLNWVGGDNVAIDNVGTFDLAPFRASDVGFSDSLTSTLKQRVAQIVADRFDNFNLLLLNSDAHDVPLLPHSTIYFGGFTVQAFAITEQVDTFNANPADNALILTGSFRAAFGQGVSLEQMAQALGNTIAHEIAHLLGLVHTDGDCTELMNATCTDDRLLSTQSFSVAEVDPDVFPIGYQAAGEILAWLLGLSD